ncbi:hypothetical protein [Geomonas sp.]|uniref:hypothetical protein n=1 Tax=Geomonas sp. TaxID=2651584 RepID=UPI002B4A1420|nr:hypothetical protein [Geomonas sp.]
MQKDGEGYQKEEGLLDHFPFVGQVSQTVWSLQWEIHSSNSKSNIRSPAIARGDLLAEDEGCSGLTKEGTVFSAAGKAALVTDRRISHKFATKMEIVGEMRKKAGVSRESFRQLQSGTMAGWPLRANPKGPGSTPAWNKVLPPGRVNGSSPTALQFPLP